MKSLRTIACFMMILFLALPAAPISAFNSAGPKDDTMKGKPAKDEPAKEKSSKDNKDDSKKEKDAKDEKGGSKKDKDAKDDKDSSRKENGSKDEEDADKKRYEGTYIGTNDGGAIITLTLTKPEKVPYYDVRGGYVRRDAAGGEENAEVKGAFYPKTGNLKARLKTMKGNKINLDGKYNDGEFDLYVGEARLFKGVSKAGGSKEKE